MLRQDGEEGDGVGWRPEDVPGEQGDDYFRRGFLGLRGWGDGAGGFGGAPAVGVPSVSIAGRASSLSG